MVSSHTITSFTSLSSWICSMYVRGM